MVVWVAAIVRRLEFFYKKGISNELSNTGGRTARAIM